MPRFGADAVWWSFPAGSLTMLALAVGYYRWGGWRKAHMLPVRPHGEAPDTGMSPPGGFEETEIAAETTGEI